MSLASVDLPAPVGPTSARRSPAGIVRSTSLQHRLAVARSANADALDLDLAPRRAGRRRPARSGTSTGVSSSSKSLFSAGAGRLHDVEQLAELLDRLEQVGEREHEEGDRADGELAVVHPPAADADDERGGEQRRRTR